MIGNETDQMTEWENTGRRRIESGYYSTTLDSDE